MPRLAISGDAVHREIGGEAVVLNLATGAYFGLNEVGSRIWALLAQSQDREAILKTLLSEYDAPAEQVGGDLDRLLGELVEKGLVRRDA